MENNIKQSYKIEELATLILSGKLVLPEIQREFVWDLNKIKELWDSIYKGYPIGQLLFWKNNPDNPEIPMYNFFDLDKNNNIDYKKLLFIAKKPTWHHSQRSIASNVIVLDGQQRLTSLILGLSTAGIHAKKRKNSPEPEIKFLSIKIKGSGDQFDWKTENELEDNEEYLPLYRAIKDERRTPETRKLKSVIRKQSIQVCDTSKLDNLEEIIEVFRRLNNGGKSMNKSELFMAMWFGGDKAGELRTKIDELRSLFGEFDIKDDFITRLIGVIFGENHNVSKNEFNGIKFIDIKKGIPRLKSAIRNAIGFIEDECHIYSDSELTSHSVLLPVIHLFYVSKDPSDKVKQQLKCFVFRALAFRLFESSTADKVVKLQDTIKNFKNRQDDLFASLDTSIKKALFGDFSDKHWIDKQIEELLDLEKGSRTNMLLLLLSDDKMNVTGGLSYDQDHLVASDLFGDPANKINANGWNKYGIEKDGDKLTEDEIKIWDNYSDKWKKNSNKLANLWLLESGRNKSKGKRLTSVWYKNLSDTQQKEFWKESLIGFNKGQSYLKITNFEQIYGERAQKLRELLFNLLRLPK
jgi:hypothetical protein